MKNRVQFALPVSFLALAALPALAAYEYPLSSNAIREAYFLGTGPTRGDADFLAEYSHTVAILTAGSYTSVVKIETLYSQLADAPLTTLNTVPTTSKQLQGRHRLSHDVCMFVRIRRKTH